MAECVICDWLEAMYRLLIVSSFKLLAKHEMIELADLQVYINTRSLFKLVSIEHAEPILQKPSKQSLTHYLTSELSRAIDNAFHEQARLRCG